MIYHVTYVTFVFQILQTREDGTISVLYPDGKKVVEYSDGTRFTSFNNENDIISINSETGEEKVSKETNPLILVCVKFHHLDTGRKLNVHETFNVSPMSRE